MYNFEAASKLLFVQRELFNILVSDRSLRHREIGNKGNLVREFDTGNLVVVRKQVKSTRKYGIYHKLVFKTKGPYRVLDKATPSSYWVHNLPLCEGLGRPGRKVKESAARMEIYHSPW